MFSFKASDFSNFQVSPTSCLHVSDRFSISSINLMRVIKTHHFLPQNNDASHHRKDLERDWREKFSSFSRVGKLKFIRETLKNDCKEFKSACPKLLSSAFEAPPLRCCCWLLCRVFLLILEQLNANIVVCFIFYYMLLCEKTCDWREGGIFIARKVDEGKNGCNLKASLTPLFCFFVALFVVFLFHCCVVDCVSRASVNVAMKISRTPPTKKM